MIIFSNFRKEQIHKRVRMVCDINVNSGGEVLPANDLWISTSLENAHFLNERVCDGYLVAGMTFGMYYGQDVNICGRVSKKLYFNLMNYGQQILINHDPGLRRINIQVEGFLTEDDFYEQEYVVGAPCSFGVDSLCTLYDRWLNEEDEEIRINSVFSFNCGINGIYGDSNTDKLLADRMKEWEKGFAELRIPIIDVDTNIHQFLHNRMYVYAASCYLGRYFCILSMQGGLRKYYIPSGFSYRDIMKFGHIPYKAQMRGKQDIGLGYEEPFLAPLLSTEHIELVFDGGQYQRTTKTEMISAWDFTRKYLNVCQPGRQTSGDFSKNCSRCPKCKYTMFALDLVGRLDLYNNVFDTDYYYANKYSILCEIVQRKNDDLLDYDVLEFAKEKGVHIPTTEELRKYYFYKWRFPEIDLFFTPIERLFEECNGKRIIVWGAGWIGSHVMATMEMLRLRAEYIVDSNREKQGKEFFGYIVEAFENVRKDIKGVVIVCGIGIYEDVRSQADADFDCVDIVRLLDKR